MAATLQFTTGAWSGKSIPLREPEAKIGRDPNLEVVIPVEDQRFVSRVHATIRKESNRYVIEDRNSSNGTLVNGARIQRAVLATGDEIQFGRQGPVARFISDTAYAETLIETGKETVVAPRYSPPPRPQPPPAMPQPRLQPPPPAHAAAPRPHAPAPRPPAAPSEPASQIVRRIVSEALATNVKRSRRRWIAAAVVIVAAGVGATVAVERMGLLESPEQAFARLADDYQGRVVLVEVGVSHNGRYVRLGNGTGFFADKGGLIVTNKHVVYSHLYSSESACIAQSFRRREIAYEKALVISVWPGGTEFRQKASNPAGDRGLGYSTDNGTLALIATASDTLQPPVTIQCRDAFGGSPFEYEWQQHAMDNHDLAVLRASKSLDPLPLADAEPKTDDDVMVLGFPTGTVPLETNKAEPIRRVGNVLRTRDTIQIDAVVLGGNSGGPLIDRNGEVVGVTTRGTAESLNMAIKAEHVRRLLERVR